MAVDNINGMSLHSIIDAASPNVTGTLGAWQFEAPAIAPGEPLLQAAVAAGVAANVGAPVSTGTTSAALESPPTGLDPQQQAAVDAALTQSNAAAASTPSAVTAGAPVNVPAPPAATVSTTVQNTVGGIITDITDLGQIGDDITAIHNGGAGKIHWWGWEATLHEPATQALVRLLNHDVPTVVTALALAFAATVPVFAAISAIIGIVGAAMGTDVTNADTSAKGVTMKGYLWVGLSVKSN